LECGGEAEAIGEYIGFFHVAASYIPLLIERRKLDLEGPAGGNLMTIFFGRSLEPAGSSRKI
jgi:hypothetical protein